MLVHRLVHEIMINRNMHPLLHAVPTRKPDYQLLLEVEHSSGHTKKKENGWSIETMNLEWGGKQSILSSSKLTEKCLGGIMEYEAITKDKNAIIYKRISVGEIQHTVFNEGG